MRRAALGTVLLLSACGGVQQATPPGPSAPAHGSLGDTWTWSGAAWHRAAVAGPSPRYLAAAAYDADRKQFVLYGGQTAKGTSDETWLWDGKTWRAANPVHKPAARRATGMAWDPATHAVVLYGGLVADAFEGHESADTWTWNGTDWSEVDAGPGPPGLRQNPTLTDAGNRLLLFGGNEGNIAYFGDAWSWRNGTWARADQAPRPQGRGASAVAWDASTSTMFAYGGFGLNASGGPGALGTPLGDGWSLTNGAWKELGAEGPGRLEYANAIWSGSRFTVLLGMHCPNPSDAAWSWDGTSWSQDAKPGISARWGAALAQAPDGTALLFGGSNEPGC
jgi:hypothetical protein